MKAYIHKIFDKSLKSYHAEDKKLTKNVVTPIINLLIVSIMTTESFVAEHLEMNDLSVSKVSQLSPR